MPTLVNPSSPGCEAEPIVFRIPWAEHQHAVDAFKANVVVHPFLPGFIAERIAVRPIDIRWEDNEVVEGMAEITVEYRRWTVLTQMPARPPTMVGVAPCP